MKKTFKFSADTLIKDDPQYKIYITKGDITTEGSNSEECEKKAWERIYDALVSIGKPQILLDKGRVVDEGAALIMNVTYRLSKK